MSFFLPLFDKFQEFCIYTEKNLNSLLTVNYSEKEQRNIRAFIETVSRTSLTKENIMIHIEQFCSSESISMTTIQKILNGGVPIPENHNEHNLFPGIDFLWSKIKSTELSNHEILQAFPLFSVQEVVQSANKHHLNHIFGHDVDYFIFVDSDYPHPNLRKYIPKADFTQGISTRCRYTPEKNGMGIVNQNSDSVLFRLSGQCVDNFFIHSLSIKWCIHANSLNILMGDIQTKEEKTDQTNTHLFEKREFVNYFPKYLQPIIRDNWKFDHVADKDDWFINTTDHLFNTNSDGSTVDNPTVLDLHHENLVFKYDLENLTQPELQEPIIVGEKERVLKKGTDFRLIAKQIPVGTQIGSLYIRDKTKSQYTKLGSFTNTEPFICSKYGEYIHFRHHTREERDPEKLKRWCPFHQTGSL